MKKDQGRPRMLEGEKRNHAMTLYFNYQELERVYRMLRGKGSKPKQLRDRVVGWSNK